MDNKIYTTQSDVYKKYEKIIKKHQNIMKTVHKSVSEKIIVNVIMKLTYRITKKLNKKQKLLKNIKWSDGESNTDMEYSTLSCKFCEKIWNSMKKKNNKLHNISMVSTPPDIQCEFRDDKNRCIKKKIELKSSKNRIMPGSTIRNLDINQPMIYCLRPKSPDGKYEIRYSQYYKAMGENSYELFQDRTPRPSINFNKMTSDPFVCSEYVEKNKSEWISHYAKCAYNRINTQCTYSWQDELVQMLKDMFINEFIDKTSEEKFLEIKNKF